MIIKKIFDNVMDEEVHSELLKFGRGEYSNRYLIEVNKQGSGWRIKTSSEFGNFFVKRCLPSGKVAIKGVIISTFELDVDFEIKKTSNFQGIRKTEIDTELEGQKILDLIEKYPRCFFALSFKTDKCDLKIKPKAPKSAKPGKSGEDGPKADFCSLKTTDKEIVDELLFDIKGDFKEGKINHTIKIDEIIYPSDFKDMKPEEVREKSKRKGKVIRKIEVDGEVFKEEAEFEA